MAERRRPGFLTFIAGLYTFTAGMIVLMGLMAVIGIGTYRINGQQVSPDEFLTRAMPLFLTVGAAVGTIAYGVWRDRAWARPLLLGFVLTITVAPVIMAALTGGNVAELLPSAVVMLLFTGFLAWYLYRKSNVVAYFDADDETGAVGRQAAHHD